MIAGLLLHLSVFAQLIEMDPVTVTATIQPQTSSTTGRNLLVVRGELFDKLPVHSIDELLRFLPGIEVQQRGPMGSQSDIVIRGGTFQQVLVLLDGIRVNDPNTGHFNSYIPIAPGEIERVEILKGASSALYGSDAVGGVVHIISKSFAARAGRQKKELELQAAGGDYGYWNLGGSGFYQGTESAIGGSVHSINSKGQMQRSARGYFHNTSASLSLRQFFRKDWSLAWRTSYDRRDFSAQNFYTSFISDTASETVSTRWDQMQISKQTGTYTVRLDLGYKNVKDVYRYSPAQNPNENQSGLFQALLSYTRKFSAKSELTAGAQFQDRRIRSNDRGDHTLKQAAGFVILQQQLGTGLSLSPAMRVDWDERGGTEVIPQINISYKKGNLQLRGSAGKTIRQADFTERYNNYNKSIVTSGSIGNPNLYAERSFSYEAGIDAWTLEGRLKIAFTVFRRNQRNLIDWTPTPYAQIPRQVNLVPNGQYALASNIASVNTSGMEADIQYTKIWRENHSLAATLGIVWLDSETGGAPASFYISSHARLLVNSSLLYSHKNLELGLTAIYKKREERQATAINAHIDGHCFMVNLKVAVKCCRQRLALFGELDNVLDNRCGDILGAVLPGRWLTGGIKFRMGK